MFIIHQITVEHTLIIDTYNKQIPLEFLFNHYKSVNTKLIVIFQHIAEIPLKYRYAFNYIGFTSPPRRRHTDEIYLRCLGRFEEQYNDFKQRVDKYLCSDVISIVYAYAKRPIPSLHIFGQVLLHIRNHMFLIDNQNSDVPIRYL